MKTYEAQNVDYEVVIGLEVHAQLLTQSKMFCGCSADYAAASPNTHVCPICGGMPGVLPAINAYAVEATVMTALALGAQIPDFARFDRKNYPYPDLMKGYQISQYDHPLSLKGWLSIIVDGQEKFIGIRRVHLEEDTAKLVHGPGYSLVDMNRAGVPLMEIVSEPDIRSAEEARLYLVKLRQILIYLGVNTGNMEEGALRCDANISVRPVGHTELGVKTEVKNMNSFRAVKLALEYEAQRQIKLARAGTPILQETRGWVDAEGRTVSQRTKEYADDYRYFPEPDLPPLLLTREWVEQIRAKLPELPDAKLDRFLREYNLSLADAEVLTSERNMANWFEAAVLATRSLGPSPKSGFQVEPKAVANFVSGELFRLMKANDQTLDQVKVTPAGLAALLQMVAEGKISVSVAKPVFEEMNTTGKSAPEIVAAKGLTQISDADHLQEVADQVIANHSQAVADYRAGKEAALKFLVGQVMRATKGQGNPGVINTVLRERLKA
ncbi:MAG: Asp-tRNA(Asn)/Glu-tRNA(Gln) amidotransferase subunit GatB [Chloroflexi bacterium]|nr:Asp-tRNA(Asn)/Glu-tRNA(Gln) amidotransferase subunit GatB [Chloroflexota bacterium]